MRRRGNRGIALLGALVVISVLFPLAAFLVLELRLQALMTRNQRQQVEAVHAAEAGLLLAIAESERHSDPQPLLFGPDGVEGSADDGTFPFATDPAAVPVPAGASFRVSISRQAEHSVQLRSVGESAGGGVAEVIAVLATPGPPDPLQLSGWREVL